MLATFLTHEHHEAATPDAIKVITAQLEGKEWSASIIREVRTKVQAASQIICEDSDSHQVRLNSSYQPYPRSICSVVTARSLVLTDQLLALNDWEFIQARQLWEITIGWLKRLQTEITCKGLDSGGYEVALCPWTHGR
jgi:hypothetical protein